MSLDPPLEIDFDDDEPAPRPHPADKGQVVRTPEPYRNGGGRILPNSIEAEEYLLSCCFVDGRDLVPRCREAGLRPDSFYDSKHGIILDTIYSIFDRGLQPDVSVVAEELKATKQLDQIGGFSFLTQVSSRIPTTAQAGFFIDKVRELSLLRETIRAGTRIVEECYGFSGGIDEFLKEQQDRLKRVADGSAQSIEDEFKTRAFDPAKQIEKPAPIYTLAETTISTPGNLTAIYSQAKTGKSSLIGAMIGAAMTNPTAGHDCLGIVGPNYGKGALLHFDTEQSPYDWQQLVKSSLKRVGLSQPPPWLMSYTLTGLPAAACQKFIESSLKRAMKLHGSIHSVIIDGIADLVVDPNDPAECFPLITRLHALAIEHSTAVVSILHMNPGSENAKGRGHLGSQLERKAESNLTLEKDGDITKVWAVKQRGKAISKEKAVCFKWSDQEGMHRSCATPGSDEAKSRKGTQVEKFSFSEFKNSFPSRAEQPKPMNEIHRAAAASVPIKIEQFYNVVRRFVRDGMVEEFDKKGEKKTYRLTV